MGVDDVKSRHCLCPCCKDRHEFQKIAELQDAGLAIYHYAAHPEYLKKTNELPCVFIIRNIKDKPVSVDKLLPALNKVKKSCPRCSYLFEHVQKLVKDLPEVINKWDTIGLCDHCRMKLLPEIPRCECHNVVKKFISAQAKDHKPTSKDIKKWLSERQDFQDRGLPRPLREGTQLTRSALISSQAKDQRTTSKDINMWLSDREDFIDNELPSNDRGGKQLTRAALISSQDKAKKTTSKDINMSSQREDFIDNDELPSHDREGKRLTKSASDFNELYREGISTVNELSQKQFYSETYLNNTKRTVKIGTHFKKLFKPDANMSRDLVENEIVHKTIQPSFKSKQKHGAKDKVDLIYTKVDSEIKESDYTPKKLAKIQFSYIFPKIKSEAGKQKVKDVSSSVLIKKTRERIAKEGLKTAKVSEEDKPAKQIEKTKVDLKIGDKGKELVNTDKNLQKSSKTTEKASKRQQANETAKKKPADEPAKKKQADETVNKKQADEAAKKKQADKAAKKKQADEAAKKQAAEADMKKQKEAAKKKQAEDELQIARAERALQRENELKEKEKQKELAAKEAALKKPKSAADITQKNTLENKPDVDQTVLTSSETSSISGLDGLLEDDIHKHKKKTPKEEIVIGEKIFQYKPPLIDTKKEDDVIPENFRTEYNKKSSVIPISDGVVTALQQISKMKVKKVAEPDSNKGVIKYALSDRSFIEKGWTILPTEKLVRKMNVYRMRPAHPEFDWFQHNKNKREMHFDSGEKLAEFDGKGRGRLYYRSGRLALDYYDAEEANAQQRFVVYSSGEPDERGRTHPITILATFDYLGNGVVFDHSGKIRLKYNQTEGVVLDRDIGPVSHWKWHTLNDPPVLQQVMIDTQMAHKDPKIIKLGQPSDRKAATVHEHEANEDMLAIEFDNFIKEKSKKLTQAFKPFQIKMKALKINENFSLKVLDQASVYLIFRDGSTNIKLNIGMILDHQEIVDTDTAEVGEVSNSLERFPARTDSLAALQRSVAYAQQYEKARSGRERGISRPEPVLSAEQLVRAASRPLRPPLTTVTPDSTSNIEYCRCKKANNNLYYNSRII